MVVSDALLSTRGSERNGEGPCLQNTYRERQTNTTYDLILRPAPHMLHPLSNFKCSYMFCPLSRENSSSTSPLTNSYLFVMSHMASPSLWKAMACPVLICIIGTSRIPSLPWAPTPICGSILFGCASSSVLWAPQGLKPGVYPRAYLRTRHTSARKGTRTAGSLSS